MSLSTFCKLATDLNDWQQDYKLSTGFLYALLQWSDMAAGERQQPAQAMWRSQVSYRVFRHLEAQSKYKQNRPLLLTDGANAQLAPIIGKTDINKCSLQQGYRV